jgi:hypothetical protein
LNLIGDGKDLHLSKPSLSRELFETAHPFERRQSDQNQPIYEVDKAWHAIHFSLTGDPFEGRIPLNFLVTGGRSIGEDLGYGPLRIPV